MSGARAILLSALLVVPAPAPAQDDPDTSAAAATAGAKAPPEGTTEQSAPSARSGKTPSQAAGGGGNPAAGGSVSGGRTRIVAHAENIVTTAERGTASTDIGTSDRPGTSSTVVAEGVVTQGRGRDAHTRIGTGSGFVSAEGIYNGGGTLSIGAEGTKRNGMTCVEIYRNTCIIHYYFRRKSDPCLPGYWIDGRKCRLPSDRQHRIGD